MEVRENKKMTMGHLKYTDEEIVRRGHEWYETRIRGKVETSSKGKELVIDIETGDWEVADDLLEAARRAQARHPGAALFQMRIGYPAKIGGSSLSFREGKPPKIRIPGKGDPVIGQPRYSTEQIIQRGKEIYERDIRSRVEDGNRGKVLVIDIETAEYELDNDSDAATLRALARNPDATLYRMRIGYPALGKLGGTWTNDQR
jgi:hypothetical protein